VVEVTFEPHDEPHALIEGWRALWTELADRLPFDVGDRIVRRFPGGAVFFCAAPIDAIYATVDLNEAVTERVAMGQTGHDDEGLNALLTACRMAYESERDARLIALVQNAERRHIPCLWDDDEISLGYGRFSQTWARSACPCVGDVDWSRYRRIPVILVTGTNGKTTTARLLARMAQDAGFTVGNSSTDGLSVNGQLVDAGDWTGPGAARAVLRHPDVNFAVLETARGGLLRRGLGVTSCDAAIVTNVADDHLGDYGIYDLTDMAKAKGVVYSVVSDSGRRVFNADNVHSMALRHAYSGASIFTSVRGRDAVKAQIASGDCAVYSDGTNVFWEGRDERHVLMTIDALLMAKRGAALHDLSNALGAVALGWSVGLDWGSMRRTLECFGSRREDNPGRGRLVEVEGVRVLLDFGHNPHGVDAVLAMARRMAQPTGRIGVCFAQAGDRSDSDFRALAQTVAKHQPDKVYLRDLPERYHRGRTAHHMAKLLMDGLMESPSAPTDIERMPDELSALKSGMKWARPGDLLVHLVHLERDSVEAWLGTQIPSNSRDARHS